MEEPNMEFDVKAEIKTLLVLCKTANPYGTKPQKDADVAFWDTVKHLDRRAKDGRDPVAVGRFVRLPAKDSYAYYVVTRVTKKTVKLAYIPYGPKYESNAVQDGEAEITLIETTLAWYDRLEELFKALGRKPLIDTTAQPTPIRLPLE
jgi:hypothetical protein